MQRAERETWAYADFLTLLVSEEIAHPQQTRPGRLTRRAQFPFLKTIDDFNFTYQSSLRLHKSFKAWGRVLHDEDLAQAIIDRVLERGRLLRLDGPSVRTCT